MQQDLYGAAENWLTVQNWLIFQKQNWIKKTGKYHHEKIRENSNTRKNIKGSAAENGYRLMHIGLPLIRTKKPVHFSFSENGWIVMHRLMWNFFACSLNWRCNTYARRNMWHFDVQQFSGYGALRNIGECSNIVGKNWYSEKSDQLSLYLKKWLVSFIANIGK